MIPDLLGSAGSAKRRQRRSECIYSKRRKNDERLVPYVFDIIVHLASYKALEECNEMLEDEALSLDVASSHHLRRFMRRIINNSAPDTRHSEHILIITFHFYLFCY